MTEVWICYREFLDGNSLTRKCLMIFETKRKALNWAKAFYGLEKPIWRTSKKCLPILYKKLDLYDAIIIEKRDVF